MSTSIEKATPGKPAARRIPASRVMPADKHRADDKPRKLKKSEVRAYWNNRIDEGLKSGFIGVEESEKLTKRLLGDA